MKAKLIFYSLLKYLDFIVAALLFPFLYVLKFYRYAGSANLKYTTKLMRKVGVFPIRAHYYEPYFMGERTEISWPKLRKLPGLDLNLRSQLELLANLNGDAEFQNFINMEREKLLSSTSGGFKIDNGSYEFGDAEFLYKFILKKKPRKVVEIGCGSSTRIISAALQQVNNVSELQCNHVCIEPYEQDWLEGFENIDLRRTRIEHLDGEFFDDLQAGDLLFIDSSHMIRPNGDVLKEYLEILPRLSPGVYIHIHDIFTPRDYPAVWMANEVRFWNEQYLLEAILSNSKSYEVVASVNYLAFKYPEKFFSVIQTAQHSHEPGSFYIRKL